MTSNQKVNAICAVLNLFTTLVASGWLFALAVVALIINVIALTGDNEATSQPSREKETPEPSRDEETPKYTELTSAQVIEQLKGLDDDDALPEWMTLFPRSTVLGTYKHNPVTVGDMRHICENDTYTIMWMFRNTGPIEPYEWETAAWNPERQYHEEPDPADWWKNGNEQQKGGD